MMMASIDTASDDDGGGDDDDDDDDNSDLKSETDAATDEIKLRGQDCDNGSAAAAAAAIIEGGQPQITEAMSMCAKTSGLKK